MKTWNSYDPARWNPFLCTIGWEELGKAMNETKLYYLQCKQFQFVDSMLLGQVRWAVFFVHCRNIFVGDRWLSIPRKTGLYAYANSVTDTYRYEHTIYMAICHGSAGWPINSQSPIWLPSQTFFWRRWWLSHRVHQSHLLTLTSWLHGLVV